MSSSIAAGTAATLKSEQCTAAFVCPFRVPPVMTAVLFSAGRSLTKPLFGSDRSWPLIRKVVLRGPWPVLASGAQLVDLPGVRDANAARAKVAENYLKNWHTAPANYLTLLSFGRRASISAD